MTATGVRRESRAIGQILADTRATVYPALRAAVDQLADPVRSVAGYHFGWLDERGRPTKSAAGKAIRPALTMLSAAAVGGASRAAVPAAAAVELVHNFSLLHDDVMDDDRFRRHRRTVWAVFGIPTAVLVGDALLVLATNVLASSGSPVAGEGLRILSTALRHVVDGQSADMDFERRTDVTVPQCVAMARGKSAALVSTSCALGALFGGGNGEQVECLRAAGEQAGLAFQLADDLLGIWGDPRVTGKPTGSDLANRKKSLPVVAALASGTSAGAELGALYRLDRPLAQAELEYAANLVERAGGRAWAQDQADRCVARALDLLDGAGLDPYVTAELKTITRMTARREL